MSGFEYSRNTVPKLDRSERAEGTRQQHQRWLQLSCLIAQSSRHHRPLERERAEGTRRRERASAPVMATSSFASLQQLEPSLNAQNGTHRWERARAPVMATSSICFAPKSSSHRALEQATSTSASSGLSASLQGTQVITSSETS